MVTYKPLWKTLIDKDIKKTQLKEMAGFSSGTLARLGKDQYIEMKHIDKICQVLDCGIEDVVAVIPDTKMTPGE